MPKFKMIEFDDDNRKVVNKSTNRNKKPVNMINKNKPAVNIKKSNKKLKQRKKRGKLASFLLGFIATFTVFGVVCFGMVVLYNKSFINQEGNATFKKFVLSQTNGKIFDKDTNNSDSGLFTKISNEKTKYNFAFFGTDKGGTHTDFMVIGSYDIKANTIKMMSIPRDTYTVMPQERIQILRDSGKEILFRESGKMKMTEVHHNGGEEYGVAFLLAQLEETFKIDLDYYVKFNLDGFKYFIDEIGGVEFDVPQRMYYNDPYQDLYIDLYPGLQTLNGKQAEGVVRYRKADENNPISAGYASGDLQRINVQQDFMAAFIKQITSSENLLNTIPAMLSTGSKYIDTNVQVSVITKLLPYISNFSMENLEISVMPYEDEQKSYVYIKEPETSELINIIFYDGKVEPVDKKDLEIAVLNASYTSGLATKTSETLKEKGYNVVYIGDYNGNKLSNSEIRVKERGMEENLRELFPDATVRVDSGVSEDVEIILGIQ